MDNSKKPKTQDISHEALRLGRLLDRQPDGRYLIVLEKTSPKKQPQVGWDVMILRVNEEDHVTFKRKTKPPPGA